MTEASLLDFMPSNGRRGPAAPPSGPGGRYQPPGGGMDRGGRRMDRGDRGGRMDRDRGGRSMDRDRGRGGRMGSSMDGEVDLTALPAGPRDRNDGGNYDDRGYEVRRGGGFDDDDDDDGAADLAVDWRSGPTRGGGDDDRDRRPAGRADEGSWGRGGPARDEGRADRDSWTRAAPRDSGRDDRDRDRSGGRDSWARGGARDDDRPSRGNPDRDSWARGGAREEERPSRGGDRDSWARGGTRGGDDRGARGGDDRGARRGGSRYEEREPARPRLALQRRTKPVQATEPAEPVAAEETDKWSKMFVGSRGGRRAGAAAAAPRAGANDRFAALKEDDAPARPADGGRFAGLVAERERDEPAARPDDGGRFAGLAVDREERYERRPDADFGNFGNGRRDRDERDDERPGRRNRDADFSSFGGGRRDRDERDGDRYGRDERDGDRRRDADFSSFGGGRRDRDERDERGPGGFGDRGRRDDRRGGYGEREERGSSYGRGEDRDSAPRGSHSALRRKKVQAALSGNSKVEEVVPAVDESLVLGTLQLNVNKILEVYVNDLSMNADAEAIKALKALEQPQYWTNIAQLVLAAASTADSRADRKLLIELAATLRADEVVTADQMTEAAKAAVAAASGDDEEELAGVLAKLAKRKTIDEEVEEINALLVKCGLRTAAPAGEGNNAAVADSRSPAELAAAIAASDKRGEELKAVAEELAAGREDEVAGEVLAAVVKVAYEASKLNKAGTPFLEENFGAALSGLIFENKARSVAALRSMIAFFNGIGFPKGLLEATYMHLYDKDIIDAEGFEAWKQDYDDETEGRPKAILQLTRWFKWLAEVEAESSGEESSDEESEDDN